MRLSTQVICGCGGVDVLLDLLTTGHSTKVLVAAAAALRDLLVWPKAQVRHGGFRTGHIVFWRTTSVSPCSTHVCDTTIDWSLV